MTTTSDTIHILPGDDDVVVINGPVGNPVSADDFPFDELVPLSPTAEKTLFVSGQRDLRTEDTSEFDHLVLQSLESGTALARLDASQMTFKTVSFVSLNNRPGTISVTTDTDDIDVSAIEFIGFEAGRDKVELVGNGQANAIVGSAVEDFVRAGGGNDTINTGAGDDDVRAGDGDDVIFDGAGDDFLRGENGNDGFMGGEGADTIEGGNGVDGVSYFFSSAGVQVALNGGSAAQSGGDAEGDVLRNIENVGGSSFADQITGNNAANLILGAGGDDVIDGKAGRDTIDGGAGDDIVIVRDGANRSFDGGDGVDTLRLIDRVGLFDDEFKGFEKLEIVAKGSDGLARLDASQMTFEEITFNSVNGRAGVVEVRMDTDDVDLSDIQFNGFVDGRDRVDIVANGNRNEIIGSEVKDHVRAGGGNDTIDSGAGNDDVRAGNGDDRLFGGAGDDFLRGEDGNDLIDGGEGADTIEGGNGRDTVTYASSDAGVEVTLNGGSAAQSGGDAEGDVLRNIENVGGSEHNDRITGNDAANLIAGFDGNDTIFGALGQDTIYAGDGDDLIFATGSSSGRVFDGGYGEDTLVTLGNVDLTNNVLSSIEKLEIQGSGNGVNRVTVDEEGFNSIGEINLNRSSEEAFIFEIKLDGNSFSASDAFISGFQSGRDVVVIDERDDSSQLSEYLHISSLFPALFTPFAAIVDAIFNKPEAASNKSIGGTAMDDFILSGSGADFLRGGGGSDTLISGDGNDRLTGRSGNDVLLGGTGNDTLVGGEEADVIDGGNGTDQASYLSSSAAVQISLNGGSAAQSGGDAEGDLLRNIENVSGSLHDDRITGNDAANVLRGSAGDDVIDGGRGRDVLRGDAGDDVIIARADGAETYDGGSGNDTLRTINQVGLFDDDISSIENLEIQAVAGENALVRLDASQMTFETITFNSVNGRAGVVEVRMDTDDVDLSDIEFTGFVDGRDQVNIVANGNANQIIGSEVNDFVRAGGGNDFVTTRNGNDHVRAGNGDDKVFGGSGDDFLRGENGDDFIVGSEGADTIEGGAGDDTLDGGTGDDLLTGGFGADVFDFAERAGFGDDIITDFEQGELIRVYKEKRVSDFEHLDIRQVQNGASTDTVIELENGSITLLGVDFALDASNFDIF